MDNTETLTCCWRFDVGFWLLLPGRHDDRPHQWPHAGLGDIVTRAHRAVSLLNKLTSITG